jgi:acetylglutamate kinase
MNLIRSEKRPVKDIDYGFAGDVKEVNTGILSSLISQGIVPILAPLTHDKQGRILNTNADTIAGETAKALAKVFDVNLVYCFEKKGVLMDENDDNSVIPSLNKAEFKDLVQKGIIQGGMIPKLDNAFESVEAGVKEVVITSADEIGKNSGTHIYLP